MFLTVFIIVFAAFLLISVGFIFRKADLELWKAFIPFYNEYCLCSIIDRIDIFKKEVITFIITSFLFIFFSIITVMVTAKMPESTALITVLVILNYLIAIIFGIYFMFLSFYKCQDIAYAFDRSNKFGIGLLVVPIIFFPMIAFSQDEYFGMYD